jgi:hypothetical protein
MLRDQTIAVACMIVLVDVLWVFALLAWMHHRSGKTSLACVALVGMLACAAALSRHLRRERGEVAAALGQLLRSNLRDR